ncbi:hypothetical protein [Pseudomonas lundensis]|uniref:hypothetical protein n=1 Tax=Pseudomonas lundensis TaxID=86185 RepID=UPI000A4E395F|nr:hypothetical protein [Pseudomonas lundensis]
MKQIVANTNFWIRFFNRVLSRVDRADALLKKQQAVFIWLLSNPPDSLFEGR